MRLLFVLDQWPELSETFVVNELEALRRQGHAVRVQAARIAPHPNPEAPARRRRRAARRPARLARPRVAARAPAGARARATSRARRRWRREEWVRPLRALAGPARRIVSGGDEHLHAHFAAGAALDALRLSALTGRPYSVTAHAYDIFAQPRNLREKLERAARGVHGLRLQRRAAARARAARRRARGRHGRRRRARSRATAPLPGGRTVLAVGRLVEKKGFDVLVDAAALARRRARCGSSATGRCARALERRIAATGAPVELLGSRPPAEVLAAMQEADVLAMPCVVARDGDRDSMPVVVKEAMAMGLLVVASDEVGLPECVLAPWGFLARARRRARRSRRRCARRSRSTPASARAAGDGGARVGARARRRRPRDGARWRRSSSASVGRSAGGTSTRSRGLSAIVRQPASIAQRCSRVGCGG